MRRPALSILKWLAIVLVVITALISFTGYRKIKAIADLKVATNYRGGIFYKLSGDNSRCGKILDQLFQTFLRAIDVDPLSDAPEHIASFGTQVKTFQRHFRLIFYGKITALYLSLDHAFNVNNLVQALENFGQITTFSIHERGAAAISETEWNQLCASTRRHHHLTQLVIYGTEITDAALTHLQNHPSIETIHVSPSRLTPESATTFKTLPKLKELNIYTPVLSTLSDSEIEALMKSLQAELPSVAVQRHY